MSLKRSVITASLFVLFGAGEALASSVTFPTTGYTLSLGNIDMRTYDGPGFNTINKVFPAQPSNFLEIGSFNGGTNGVEYEMYFLSSVAFYKDQNEFGLMNDNGDFVSSVKGSSALGSKATYSQGSNENLKFAFKSPESTFYTQAAKNADGQVHMLGIQFTQDGLLTIPSADLHGGYTEFFVNASTDTLFFMEDMMLNSNFQLNNGTDNDYNDFVVLVRAKAKEVPEPATLLLLGAGSLMAFHRRRQAA